jgi:bacterioferritin-associated ferredoxin
MDKKQFGHMPSIRWRSTVFPIAVVAGAALLSVLFAANNVQADGPGTEMTKIINRAGMGADCGRCKALAAQMDQGGSKWVQQNKHYVVSRTISNAEKLGHRMGPMKRIGVRTIVNRSVRRSR